MSADTGPAHWWIPFDDVDLVSARRGARWPRGGGGR